MNKNIILRDLSSNTELNYTLNNFLDVFATEIKIIKNKLHENNQYCKIEDEEVGIYPDAPLECVLKHFNEYSYNYKIVK